MVKIIRCGLSIILLLLGVTLLTWAALPNTRQEQAQYLSPSDMEVPSSTQGAIPAILEYRRVRLEWPTTLRIGEEEIILMVFEPGHGEILAPSPQAKLIDVYDRYNIMAEARFEVAGIRLSPDNPIRESMPAGQAVSFQWRITTHQVGSYRGTVWLSLRFLPLDGSQAIQEPIYIQDIKLESSSLFGLNETATYVLGGLCLMMSVGLIFNDMIGWLKKKISIKITEDTKVSKL